MDRSVVRYRLVTHWSGAERPSETYGDDAVLAFWEGRAREFTAQHADVKLQLQRQVLDLDRLDGDWETVGEFCGERRR